jgi:hypothetical protein
LLLPLRGCFAEGRMQTIVEVALSKAAYGESEILACFRKDLAKERALRGMNCGV